MTEKIPVNISKEIIDQIKEQVENSDGEFKDIEEYIEFVLSEVLKDDEPEQEFTPEEEEEIKKRLRSLGYIS